MSNNKKGYEVKQAFYADKTYLSGEFVKTIPVGYEQFFKDQKPYISERQRIRNIEEGMEDEEEEDKDSETGDGNKTNIISTKNSIEEIKSYAEDNEIDLGDAKSKKEMIEVIEDNQ